MQGDATVLLVSVGQPPEGLQAELERLQVKVVCSGFTDAEEEMDSSEADLVVLSGARGAMELATLLDDQGAENRPRMVIVAERKDLAKLRGLNREVVISLFALETTEKVVAQRIESLARRAARRRRPVEEGEVTRTAMGLPMAAVAKVQLQKAPAPPRVNSALTSGPASAPGRNLGRSDDTTSQGAQTIKSDEAQEAADQDREASPMEAAKQEPSRSEFAGTKGFDVSSPRDARGPATIKGTAPAPDRQPSPQTVKGMSIGQPQRPPRDPEKPTSLKIPPAVQVEAPRAAPPRAAFVEPPRSPQQPEPVLESLVPDDDLISLRPSEFSEDDEVTKVADIPGDAGVPRFDDDFLEVQTSVPPISIGPPDSTDLGELDISLAEQALENLDSVKLALDDGVREAARQHLTQGDARVAESPEELTARAPDIADRETPHVPLDALPESESGDRPLSVSGDDDARREPPSAPPADLADSPDSAKDEPRPLSSLEELDWFENPARGGLKGEFAATQPATGVSPFAEELAAEQRADADSAPALASDVAAKSATASGAENDHDNREPSAASKDAASKDAASKDATPKDVPPSSDITKTIPSGTPPQPAAEKKKGGGGPLAFGLAALAVGAIGLGVASGAFERGQPQAVAERPADATASAAPSTASATADAPADTAAEPTMAEAPSPGTDSSASAPSNEGVAPSQDALGDSPTDAASPPAGAAASAAPATPGGSAASGTLADPFLVEESDAPSCEKLLGSDPPKPGGDPVHQASDAWNAARKFIVEGKVDEAHHKMCEAVSLNPESAAAEGLAGLYLRLRAPRQALKWLEKAEKIDPGQKELVALRGDIYSQLGRSDEARKVWLEMLAVGPEETRRIQAVSKDYSVDAGKSLRRGDLVRAEMWFRRAITLDPENVAGVMGLAKTFHRAEKRAHARTFALRALEISDVIPEVHVLLGEIALEEGNQAEAKQRFERALEVRPGFFPAKRGLSQVVKQ